MSKRCPRNHNLLMLLMMGVWGILSLLPASTEALPRITPPSAIILTQNILYPGSTRVRGGSADTDYDPEEERARRPSSSKKTTTDFEEEDFSEVYDDEVEVSEEEDEEDAMEAVDAEYEDHSFVMLEEEDDDEGSVEEEAAIEEEEEQPTVLAVESAATSTQEALERATAAGYSHEDEGSSAFVDRMELADAYDESFLVSDDASHTATLSANEDHEALAAATAVGAGGSDDPDAEVGQADVVPVEEKGTEEEDTQAAQGISIAESSSCQEITKEMQDILTGKLGFTPRDVKALRPEIAEFLIENNLQKPVEGMLPNWYVPGALQKTQKARKVLRQASVAIVTAGAVALLAVQGPDMDSIHDALKAIPAAAGAALLSSSSSKRESTFEIVAPDTSAESEEEEQPAAVVEDAFDHPHSVKPGSTTVPIYEKDLDKTALDRFLTKIENAVKAFFRIKI